MNRSRVRVAATVLVVLTAAMLLVATAHISTGTSVESRQQITNTTSYDGNTAPQRISVTLTLSPADQRMSDIRVEIASARRTLLLADSFTTTITPSNQRVNVTPRGSGVFIIEKLDPGETVDIEFAVVPTTLGPERITAAEMTVEYAQDGRSPTRSLSPTVDISSNPWHRANQSSDRLSMPLTVGGAFGIGVVGLIVGAGLIRSRQDSGVAWDAVEPAIDRAKRRVDDTVATAELEQLESTLRKRLEVDETDQEADSGLGSSVLAAISGPIRSDSEGDDSNEEFPEL